MLIRVSTWSRHFCCWKKRIFRASEEPPFLSKGPILTGYVGGQDERQTDAVQPCCLSLSAGSPPCFPRRCACVLLRHCSVAIFFRFDEIAVFKIQQCRNFAQEVLSEQGASCQIATYISNCNTTTCLMPAGCPSLQGCMECRQRGRGRQRCEDQA